IVEVMRMKGLWSIAMDLGNSQSSRSGVVHYDETSRPATGGGIATMKRPPEGLGPIVVVDRRLGQPLYAQLSDGYREGLLDGRLRHGQRLPATRTGAQDLQVSRLPVVKAFEQLVAEGYRRSRVGAGSFVSPALPARPAAVTQPRAGPRRRVPPSPLTATDESWLAHHRPFRLGPPDPPAP